jgi:uncharacterized protein YecE (DUF72 family)
MPKRGGTRKVTTSTDPDPHDPGVDEAARRADALAGVHAEPLTVGTAEVRIGTAGWTDPTLTKRGVFYPAGADSAEDRLRYYASRFSMVEVDSTYYALPVSAMAERWVERTPDGFVFDVKAHALMTGHPTDPRRLPAALREELGGSAGARRVYPGDLSDVVLDRVWEWFRDALRPLHEAGKMGAVLLQYPPWYLPSKDNVARILEARDRLAPLQIAVELRNARWFSERVGPRTMAWCTEHAVPLVMVDEPQGTPHSVPRRVTVTSRSLATLRLHGRKADTWARRGASVAEKYRYLYDREELQSLVPDVEDAGREARRLHIIFNNCYGNYGTTNALELAALLARAAAGGG